MARYRPVDLRKVKTIPVQRRGGAYRREQFARPPKARDNVGRFFAGLPDILKGREWQQLIEQIARAYKRDKPIIWLLGAHVIKCGLSPVVIDLMKHGVVGALCMHGAGAIHDLEVAHLGSTSEDVLTNLHDGTFGMARETAAWFAEGIECAREKSCGLGAGFGHSLSRRGIPHRRYSLFYNALKLDIPATVHVAIGADIVAQHPNFDAATVGETSHRDFKLLCGVARKLHRGGVVILFGSAVVLPEIFLKALAVARNLGRVDNFSTANFDMIQHYRPLQNVVRRPTAKSGHGFTFTGHHEIMLPLLAAAIKHRLRLK